mmetsp:Transcript_41980/g.50883  ORF Transcript_41980/g.50883 Transcript_41980/m.50883 type:complete len:584 (-) Transcript_41980:193-1944(-)|eukprot:CAMPEP_0197860820 /NCGR_PEP_ID=MMETSP1438-20131217/36467_1 /TAXON_ID=1461541 /ORGANISM="Pterosperma sp., Strain CCMP1384" /LENGTH=583 /DNA_ID=CAMNT_0043477807 /DNA_START=80 /DNA_END=1831 /DNA_ORIENTATION=-
MALELGELAIAGAVHVGFSKYLQVSCSLSAKVAGLSLDGTAASASDAYQLEYAPSKKLTIAEAFVLIWQNDKTGDIDGRKAAKECQAIAIAACMLDLVLLGKLKMEIYKDEEKEHEVVCVGDASSPLPESSAFLQFLFDMFLEKDHQMRLSISKWIMTLLSQDESPTDELIKKITESLIKKGIVTKGSSWGFSVFPTEDPAAEGKTKEKIKSVLLKGEEADVFTSSLIYMSLAVDSMSASSCFMPACLSKDELQEAKEGRLKQYMEQLEKDGDIFVEEFEADVSKKLLPKACRLCTNVAGIGLAGATVSPSDAYQLEYVLNKKLTLAEAFILIWQDDETGNIDGRKSSQEIQSIAVAACMLDLLLLGRLKIETRTQYGREDQVVSVGDVSSPLPESSAFLQVLLDMCVKRSPDAALTVGQWIETLVIAKDSPTDTLIKQITESLVTKGIVKKGSKWGSRVFPTEDPTAEGKTKEKIKDVLLKGVEPDVFTTCLIYFSIAADSMSWSKSFMPACLSKDEIKQAREGGRLKEMEEELTAQDAAAAEEEKALRIAAGKKAAGAAVCLGVGIVAEEVIDKEVAGIMK